MLLLLCILYLFGVLQIYALPVIEIPKGVSLSATRTIDLTSQIVKIKVEYEIKNTGSSELKYFVHVMDSKETENLAYISANEVGATGNKKTQVKLEVSQVCILKLFKKFNWFF